MYVHGGGWWLGTPVDDVYSAITWVADQIAQYCPPERRTEPYASPALAPELSGLPPTLVLAAEYDVLRDDGDLFVRRLTDAGVPAEFVCWPGHIHGSHEMTKMLPSARECRSRPTTSSASTSVPSTDLAAPPVEEVAQQPSRNRQAILNGVSAFALDDPEPSPDFYIIRDGSLSLFWSPTVLVDVCDQLAELGYHVVRIDAGGWTKPSDLYDAVAAALDFPEYFGRNLSALNDCLSDVATGDYGVPLEAAGLALVVSGFDAFAKQEPQVAEALADIFAAQSRFALMFGRRMLCLLQSADPSFNLPAVGGIRVPWNPAEWANSDRGL